MYFIYSMKGVNKSILVYNFLLSCTENTVYVVMISTGILLTDLKFSMKSYLQ